MNRAEKLIRETAGRIALRQHLPEATYRLQFHAGFTFRDARAIVALFARSRHHPLLCLALSPGAARQPARLRHHRSPRRSIPKSARQEDYEAWVDELHAHGMGQILDMVPNHMGIAGNGNAWWNDVLENGPSSPYAGYFDIAWQDSPRPELHNRVLLPVLGDPYGKVLEAAANPPGL